MAKEQRDYHSYLLRLWRTTGLGGSTWHAMLENPHTGERHGFATLADLFTFLENKLIPPEQDTSEQGPSS
jgi:hypothetical protein